MIHNLKGTKGYTDKRQPFLCILPDISCVYLKRASFWWLTARAANREEGFSLTQPVPGRGEIRQLQSPNLGSTHSLSKQLSSTYSTSKPGTPPGLQLPEKLCSAAGSQC